MKILLLGAAGQVGQALHRNLAAVGDIVAATRNGQLGDGTACETADFDQLDSVPALIQRIAPDVVVNAAAYTAVDRAEDEPEAAFRANAQAPDLIAQACKRRGALLVHYSTDYVFDGRGTRPYREDDATAPIGVYGASKLAGEQAIADSGCRHLILRTAWVYAAHGSNFLRTMLRLAAEREALRVVADQVGSPTPAWMIADVTTQLLGKWPHESGLWHLAADGATSWHGFAEAIFTGAVERRLMARAPQLQAIASADYPTRAARPAWSVLDTTKLRRDFGLTLPGWDAALSRTLDQMA